MHWSNQGKLFFTLVLLTAALSIGGCGFWQTGPATETAANISVADNLTVEIPFATREPDVFQAEFVLTHYAGGTKYERVIRAARNGQRVRYDYPTGLSFLQVGENERLLLSTEKKIYAKSLTMPPVSEGSVDSLRDFLTTKWLNENSASHFEDLGTADGLRRYRVKPDGTDTEKSEIIIYFDENLQIPVKQEFYSISNGQKYLQSSIEIRNFKPEAEDSVFTLPKGFTEVPVEEFQWKK